MSHRVRYAVLIATLLSGCADRSRSVAIAVDGREIQTLDHELPDEYTWLVDHGATLTCDEFQRVERGEILWDRVEAIRAALPEDPGFITRVSLIRVLSPQRLADYKQAVAALPDASDPDAIAKIRAQLQLRSAFSASEETADLRQLGLDPKRVRLAPARVAAAPAGCPRPLPPITNHDEDECTDPGGGTGGSGYGGLVAMDEAKAWGDAPVCDTCKVTCDLSVALDSVGDATVKWTRDVTKGDSDGTAKSDVNNGDGGAAPLLTARHRYFTTAVTCTATGCDKNTWKANVTPGNLGDGSMSVTIAGSTTNPDFSTTINSSCSVSVNALAQSSLTMDKNADDCGAANKNPKFDHKMEILYAVHTESSTESSSETSGSVGVTYEANQNTTTAANANIKATGAGKDGLKIDGGDVTGQINGQNSVSFSGKTGFSYVFRRSKKDKSDWQAGTTTLALLDQIIGPPSLTLTNECAQKTIAYKYDLANFLSDMKWETNTFTTGSNPLCASRLEASMPALPGMINFACTYTTSASTDVKSCKGQLTKP